MTEVFAGIFRSAMRSCIASEDEYLYHSLLYGAGGVSVNNRVAACVCGIFRYL